MTTSTEFGRRASLRRTSPRAREHGAALIIGLVLLLALTVLGISGMNMSALELMMAANDQSQQRAFQRAETGIDRAIAQPAVPGPPVQATQDVDGDGTTDIQSETTFVTTTLPPDGAFSTDIAAFHFDTVSVGSGPRNAVSTHSQSFYVIGPSIN